MIELVFAMFILALITRITLPKFNSVLRLNMKSGASRVAAYLQAAYERSIMRHERIRVSFDPESGKFWAEIRKPLSVDPPWTADTKIEDAIDKLEERAEKADERKKAGAAPFDYEKLEAEDLKGGELPPGVRVKGVYLLAEKRLLTDITPYIEFSPSGFASPVIVYLTNDDGDVYSVILSAIGGKTRVEKGETEPGEA